MNSVDAYKLLTMNNKAVKDAIKKGCRLFPEFDMQGFRLVCKICNIPMDINDNTRLIDLEAHTKSVEHLANMGTEKTRMTRAKAQKLNKSESSPNLSVDKCSAENSSSPPISSPSTSHQQISSTPSTTSKKKSKAGRPRKGRSLLPINSTKSVPSESLISETSSSSTFSSSSSFTTVCSISPLTAANRRLTVTKKNDSTPKSRDKIIVLSDDTQESVYLSGSDDEADIGNIKSTNTVDNGSSSKISTKEDAKNSRDGVNHNQMKSFSLSKPVVTPKSEPTEVPSTIAQAVSVAESQISESQNDQQTLTSKNDLPEPSLNPDNDLNVKDNLQADSPVDSTVTSSDADLDVSCDGINGQQESALISDSNQILKPGDSLLFPTNLASSAIPISLPLALTYPSTDPDSNHNDSGNFNETEDVDKTIKTPNQFPNQTTSTPESGNSEQLTKSGAKRQRKRKQDSVKEEPATPSKTTRPYVRKTISSQLDPKTEGDSVIKSKSGHKMGRKRKIMRMCRPGCRPPPTDVDTVSPITASDDNVNPLRRINSIERSGPADCSESVSPSTNNGLNSSDLSIPSSSRETEPSTSRQLSLMLPPISMATNEVTTTNSNSLEGGEHSQRDTINFNTTYNVNTADNTISTPNTSTYNSLSEINGKVIKKEAQVQCEFDNVPRNSVKPEPAGSNDEYQSGRLDFYADLIKFCLDSNISYKKLTGSDSRSFFHKNFGVSIPLADEMKSRVLLPLQKSKMEKLKQIVADHNIYLIMKIHNNDERGHILTIMVGVLNGQPAQPYLYKLSIIQEVDLTVLSRELLNALHYLYQGLVFEKLSLLITDDSPLMGQIASFLKTLHPKVRHITCFYQVCDDICEQFRKSHPHMKLYVNTINGFLFSSPKILSKYKKLSNKYRELPIPASKLHGFNWMLVAGDFFEEHNKITAAIDGSLEGSTKENYLVKINCLLENKDLQMEWIDFNGYSCLEMAIDSMKSQTMSITQMKTMIEGLGRSPKRSIILQRIKDLLQSSPSFGEMLTIAEKIATDEETDPNIKLFSYAPLNTLASFDCYDTFLTILQENGGFSEDSLLEILTFLAHNKDL